MSNQPKDAISGLVERVTFHSGDTGFAVVRVKVTGRRDLVTVVGSVPSVNAGEWLNAQGHWIQDRDHGLQLKAESIQCCPPNSKEGLEKYLGSGLIKGIGPVYAKKLVAKFGEKIFSVIDHESARLQEVEGIGAERRRLIKSAWNEQKTVREIMVFLHSNGVSTSKAVRIYKRYGDEAIEAVRSNPYALARDIHGIGFKSADQIAQNLGIPKDSLLRARAGLVHVLLEGSGQGHCALPRELLCEQALALLQVDEAVVTEALERLLLDGEIVSEPLRQGPLIYLPQLRAAEAGIAKMLSQQAAMALSFPPIDLEKAILWAQEKTGKELAPSQARALREVLQARVSVITGGPGVGKTTLLHAYLLILRAKKLQCLLCAPTGRASKRLGQATGMEAKTIHRLLECGGNGSCGRNAQRPLECDVLVVDESSMLDVPLFHKLLQALPKNAHLLLVGDVDQLPSVGPGSVLADIIQSGIVQVVRLTEIFRQAATSQIITSAHRVNEGQLPEPGKADSDFFFVEREEAEAIQASLLEMVAERIPRKLGLERINDVQVLCPMNRGSLGARELNLLLQRSLNPPLPGQAGVERFGTEFRVGDKVIQTENNYDKEVFNGDIGRIKSIDLQEQQVSVAFEEREVLYELSELDEISLAYAITIHKSQGSEFPAVVVPLATQHYLLLQRNLLYTAITRGKQFVVIVGQKKALSLAVSNATTKERYSGLRERLTSMGLSGRA